MVLSWTISFYVTWCFPSFKLWTLGTRETVRYLCRELFGRTADDKVNSGEHKMVPTKWTVLWSSTFLFWLILELTLYFKQGMSLYTEKVLNLEIICVSSGKVTEFICALGQIKWDSASVFCVWPLLYIILPQVLKQRSGIAASWCQINVWEVGST